MKMKAGDRVKFDVDFYLSENSTHTPQVKNHLRSIKGKSTILKKSSWGRGKMDLVDSVSGEHLFIAVDERYLAKVSLGKLTIKDLLKAS